MREQIREAERERERCFALIGERLGMIAKYREQQDKIARLTRRLEKLQDAGRAALKEKAND